MKKSIENFVQVFHEGFKSGMIIMGDSFIGYKFIGERSLFWNNLLRESCPDDLFVNDKFIHDNNINTIPYDFELWKTGIV